MEASTAGAGAPPSPDDPRSDLPPDAPGAVQKAATPDGVAELSPSEEADAIHWLLQPARPYRFKCTVKYDTPYGSRDLTWYIRQLDGKKIEGIEDRHRESGEGPFGKINTIMANPEVVAEATLEVQDAVSFRKLDIGSEEFRTAPNGELIPSKAEALRLRLHYQSGVLAYLAEEVRRISGYSADRVGSATRVLVDAAGN